MFGKSCIGKGTIFFFFFFFLWGRGRGDISKYGFPYLAVFKKRNSAMRRKIFTHVVVEVVDGDEDRRPVSSHTLPAITSAGCSALETKESQTTLLHAVGAT